MQYRQPSLRLRVAAKKQDRPKDQSADQTDQVPAGFVHKSRAGYDTAAATVPERNNTVTRPLEHMITGSDVPDYAELQRHYGH